MNKRLAISILTLLFTVALPTPSWAETVMEKVTRTGVLTAGTRTDAIPFAYIKEDDEWLGYSIEMLVLIRDQLEKELNKEIALEFVAVTPEDRIPKVVSREVDIVCGSTSFTWEREKFVDFSISYAVSGTKLLVKKGSNLSSPESLIGKRIGAIPKTTNEQVIKLVQPQATLVSVKNGAEGLLALQQGQIDAFAWDDILLKGLRKTSSNPDAFAVVPEQPYNREGIACMLPEDGSKFRDLVNYSLVNFMQGFVIGDSRYVAIFDRWFGSTGVIPINRDLVIDFFQDVIDSREQIPIPKGDS
ncbi:MAG: amino acid ABC transporter substrate-binding protein [Xenococcaceae cyanobacterium]